MREKLIELLNASFEAQYSKRGLLTAPHTADDLIANGVTLDNQVSSSKWIPVTERLPDGGEMVLVCSGGEVGEAFLGYAGFCWANGIPIEKKVTHWMPLPEPPKGE